MRSLPIRSRSADEFPARGISMTLSASKCRDRCRRRAVDDRRLFGLRHPAGLVIPCRPDDLARNQASARRPQRDRVALFGGGITVIANGTGNRLGQLHRIVGEDQRMNRRVVRVAVRPLAGLACLDEDSRAVAPQQPPDEVRVRLVDLPREFTRRVTFALQAGQVEFECARQRRTALAPLLEQHGEDVGQVLGAEQSRIGSPLHHRQHVANRQLVAGERTVRLSGADVGDDAVDGMETPAIGRHLHGNR